MKKYTLFIVLAIIAVYFLTGIFQVGPSEVALVKTFGKYSYMAQPGIHYRLPYPFQSHVKVDVATVRKVEIGFRSIMRGSNVDYVSIPQEALMITGDGNIVSVEAVIQYRVKDPVALAFNITEEENLVRFTTESVLREKVAMKTIDDVLTVGRDVIAMETAKQVQEILDAYSSGIKVENVYLQEVTPPEAVLEAFDDVNNAKQDRERYINEARKYANDIVPKAEGEAQMILKEAEAYANEIYLKALGEAKRFERILEEYRKAPDITRKRLFLDAMQIALTNSKNRILILDKGTLKFLNINELLDLREGGGK